MGYIFLFGQLLCCATQTASLVHVTLHALPQPIRIHRISAVTNCSMAGHWCDTSWLQTRYSISIRLCDGLLVEYTDSTASRVTNLLDISTTCWKHQGASLLFRTEIGLVDEFRLCFQRWRIPFKRIWYWYCTIIIWKHYSSFKTIYFQFSWCLPHKRKKNIVSKNYMTWTYPLQFCILCHTCSTVI